MLKKSFWLLTLLKHDSCWNILLTGCGDPGERKEGSSPHQVTPKKMKSISKEDLQKYVNKLSSLETIFDSHNVKFQSSYSDDKEAFLEVRRVGDHSKSLSDAEKAKLKHSIYEAVGVEFPLNISVYSIDEESGISGRITAIDDKGRFLVVSSDKFLDQEKKMPDAAWYGMSDDAHIEFAGKKLQPIDVQIGSSVKIWGEGLMLTSYPGQTTGLRLEIIAQDNGNGDARGKVTGLVTTGEGVNLERTMEVDGVKHRLLPIAQVWKEGEKANATEIMAGDQVKLWFAGYEFGPEQLVTKVVIER